MGERLDKLESAWKKIDFSALDAELFSKKNLDKTDSWGLKIGKAAAQEEVIKSLKPVVLACLIIETNAKTAQQNDSLSSGALKALYEIQAAAARVANTIEAFAFKEWDALIAKAEKQEATVRQKYQDGLDNLDMCLQKLDGSRTAQTWDAVFKPMTTAFTDMLGATALARSGTSPDAKAWQAAADAMRAIEKEIPSVAAVIKKESSKSGGQTNHGTKSPIAVAIDKFVIGSRSKLPALTKPSKL